MNGNKNGCGMRRLIPAVWLGLLIAPAASSGLPEILRQFPSAMNEPFYIEWCEDSLKTVLVFIALYAMVIGVYLSTRRHYRRGEEHGSAKWGNVETVNRSIGHARQSQTRCSRSTSVWG